MFRAIGRLFRNIGYLVTAQFDKISWSIASKPTVAGAVYDEVLEERKTNLQKYKKAVAGMIANEERKKLALKEALDDTVRLEKLKSGALGKAKSLVEAAQGDPALLEQVKGGVEYVKCQGAFTDFSSTLAEKQERVAELEKDLKEIGHNIASHKTQMEAWLRDIQKIADEKHETIAALLGAQKEQEIADILSGISSNKRDQDLQKVREMKAEAVANARISRELAGTDAKKQENEFLEYASKSSANSEFEDLLGIGTKKEVEAPVSQPSKISEN